jgi:hypothetical protein
MAEKSNKPREELPLRACSMTNYSINGGAMGTTLITENAIYHLNVVQGTIEGMERHKDFDRAVRDLASDVAERLTRHPQDQVRYVFSSKK